MADYPRSAVPGKLKTFLAKLPAVGVSAATSDWLKRLGYTTADDQSFLRIMKQLRLVQADGTPTEEWRSEFRDANRRGAFMAEQVRQCYSDLFETYPQAQACSDEELRIFFTTKTNGQKLAVDRLVATFKVLRDMGDWADATAAIPLVQPLERYEPDGLASAPTANTPNASSHPNVLLGSPSVTINIQLTLPESATQDNYESFFAAMRKHLFPSGE